MVATTPIPGTALTAIHSPLTEDGKVSLLHDVLKTNDERIAWILAHPRMSPWLKEALKGTRNRNPIEVLNDLKC